MATNSKIWILILALCFGLTVEVSAQKNRRRAAGQRRVNSTARQQPIVPTPTLEPEVVSTAEEMQRAEEEQQVQNGSSANPNDPTSSTAKKPSKTAERVSELSQQVGELNSKISSLDKQQRGVLELERLTRAEERAESLRRQLTETIEKEAALQARLQELDYQVRPEVVERETAAIGSIRPEEVRENRRKTLEAEKVRTNDQLKNVLESRTRLERAVTDADALVEKLRASVDATLQQEKTDEKNNTKNGASPDAVDNREPGQNSNPPQK